MIKIIPAIAFVGVTLLSFTSCDSNSSSKKDNSEQTTSGKTTDNNPVTTATDTKPSDNDSVKKVIWNGNIFTSEFSKKEGERITIEFDIDDASKKIRARVAPNQPEGNLRISQVIFPDGSSDGPFADIAEIEITQKGKHRLIIGESNMNGEPFSGNFVFEIQKQ